MGNDGHIAQGRAGAWLMGAPKDANDRAQTCAYVVAQRELGPPAGAAGFRDWQGH